ncbi:MAG: carboxypeptidase regulatory-like domain-containing protein [Gammaproteobacteria bacterium]|nr:carboxypeptidase regulatory-like domain-containing protein [Gammaproteobacteria bacterium]
MKKTIAAIALATATAISMPVIAAYKVIDVADGGSISGKVNFTGKDKAPQVYKVVKDTDTCGTENREIDYVDVKDGALRNVVVYLDKVKSGKKFDKIEANIDQKGCAFIPFMSVMTNDTTFQATNSDPVLHNIHTYEIMGRAKKTVMNVSQPKQGSVTKKKVKLKRGAGMKIECDAHDFMHGFVFVAKNPYYAVVAEDGSYTINDIPAGKYKVKAWHGTLGEQKGNAEVTGGGTATVDFTFKGK